MKTILRNFSTEILLFCGMLTMIAVSLQSVLIIRCGQMVFFMALARLAGKRVRLLPPAVMLLSVVVANLFVPNGRVLFSVWRIDVTLGALRLGLMKGSLLIGLIYVSRVSVGLELKIPGRLGALFLRTFAYFEELTERWADTRGDLLGRIDDLLMSISGEETQQTPTGSVNGGATARAAKQRRESSKGREVNAAGPVSKQTYRRNLAAAAVIIAAGWGPYIATLYIA